MRNNGSGSSGAGIYSHDNSTVMISDTLIQDNNTPLDGGGLWLGPGAAATIENSTFTDNDGRDGGGLAHLRRCHYPRQQLQRQRRPHPGDQHHSSSTAATAVA